ncbi:MAG: nickel pincer cofactor biosynthesis protein LarC [Dehalococcoidia bacterium]
MSSVGRIAYLDCFSGVSGDMLLGALLDVGVTLEGMRAELAKIPLEGYSLEAERVTKRGLAAQRAIVSVRELQSPRTLADVEALIAKSSLPAADRERGSSVFKRLAEAEAAVHGETVEMVHLHDVGAVDAVVDVMGTIAGLRLLGVEELYCSSLPSGGGWVRGSHGALPVPAPATLELLARAEAPVRAAGTDEGELVTPTGAAIIAELARFQRPEMTLNRIGYGAGSRDLPDRPNVLRLWLGEGVAQGTRSMVLIETNIDDMTGEMLGYVMEKLLAQGAADAWLTPVQMKKNRPGVMLSVICGELEEEALARFILRETSTLGVRVRPVHRWEAEREVLEFESSLGPAAVKVKRLADEPPRVAPEYEACKRLAEASGLPLAEVYRILQAEGEARLASHSPAPENLEPRT